MKVEMWWDGEGLVGVISTTIIEPAGLGGAVRFEGLAKGFRVLPGVTTAAAEEEAWYGEDLFVGVWNGFLLDREALDSVRCAFFLEGVLNTSSFSWLSSSLCREVLAPVDLPKDSVLLVFGLALALASPPTAIQVS